jgi:hypothetical protein
MATRAEVFGAVHSERLYQEQKWKDLEPHNSMADFLRYISCHHVELQQSSNVEEATNKLRKVSALCVAAMEKFGAPQREGYPVHVVEKQAIPAPVSEDTQYTAVPRLLSEEELDELVPHESEVGKVEWNVYYRTNRQTRIYYYPPNHPGSDVSDEHTFTDIIAFAVVTGGAHRLVDAYGNFFYVGAGWRVLQVNDPSFV